MLQWRRFAADFVRINGYSEVPKCNPPTGKHVAIIGLGPAGITAAEKLAQMGHAVDVLKQHYNGLAREKDAIKYFDILPEE